MPSRMDSSLSTQSTVPPTRLAGDAGAVSPAVAVAAAGGAAVSQPHAEHRAVADLGPQVQFDLQHARDALADRQSETEAALAPRRRPVEAAELVEDDALVLGGDAGPAVPDLHFDAGPARPAGDDHAAALRVAQGVRHQVLQQPAHQHAIAAHVPVGAADAQPQVALRGDRRELAFQVGEHVVQREHGQFGAHRSALEAGDVQHVVEHFLGRAQRSLDAAGDLAHGGRVGRLVAERGGEQPRRIQRLQQVVARGGDEAGLGRVGLLGGELGGGLGRERDRQFLRTLRHALLERQLGLEQLPLVVLELGDVGVGRDVAAVRHRLAADLVDAAVAARALDHVAGARAHVRDALDDLQLGIGVAELATQRVPADQVGDRSPDPHHVGRVLEHLEVATVPGDDRAPPRRPPRCPATRSPSWPAAAAG